MSFGMFGKMESTTEIDNRLKQYYGENRLKDDMIKRERIGKESQWRQILGNKNSYQKYEVPPLKQNQAQGRRQNARTRCFDMKIENISAINGKISNLLSLVKRQKNEETYQNRAHIYEANLNKANKNMEKQWRNNNNRRAAEQQIIRQGKPKIDKSQNYDLAQQYADRLYEQRKDRSGKKQKIRDINISQQQKIGELNKGNAKIQRYYAPESQSRRSPIPIQARTKSPNLRYEAAEDVKQNGKYEIKINRSTSNLSNTKRYTEKIKHADQPQLPVSIRQKYEDTQNTFQRTRNPHKAMPRQSSPVAECQFEESIQFNSIVPKPESSHLRPISPVRESQRGAKLKNTTELIEDQLNRIRNRMQASQKQDQLYSRTPTK